MKATETLKITVPVTNAGKVAGTEVLQVYVRKAKDIDGPVKTLRGFKKVNIEPGKTSQVSIDLTSSAFEFYDWTQRKMMVTPGEYEVYYGTSSDAKDLKKTSIIIR